MSTAKSPKNSDTPEICCNRSQIWTIRIKVYHRKVCPKVVDRIANCVDPEYQGGHWSGKSQGNLIFLQGQEKVKEFANWSGKF